jgi:hypothetical protein
MAVVVGGARPGAFVLGACHFVFGFFFLGVVLIFFYKPCPW